MLEAYPDCLPLHPPAPPHTPACSIRGTRVKKEGRQRTIAKKVGTSGGAAVLVPEGIWKWVGKCRFGQLGPPAGFSAAEGEQKPRGREERLPTSLPKQVTCSPRPHLVGQKESVWVWNTSRSGIWKCPGRYIQECAGEFGDCAPISCFTNGQRDSQLPLSSVVSTFSQAGSSQTLILRPIEPEFFKTSFEKPLFQFASQLSRFAAPVCALSRYMLMSRTAWPHYSAGTTTALTL